MTGDLVHSDCRTAAVDLAHPSACNANGRDGVLVNTRNAPLAASPVSNLTRRIRGRNPNSSFGMSLGTQRTT